MAWLGYSKETPALERWSDVVSRYTSRLPGKLGAVIRRIVEFIEPPPQQLTPLPVPGGALVDEVRRVAGPLYHGTASSLLPRILKEGLRPATETGVRTWTGKELASRQPGVYFARRPEEAHRLAVGAAKKHGGKPVVLRVKELSTERMLPDEDVLWGLGAEWLARTPWTESFRLKESNKLDLVRGLLRRAGLLEHLSPEERRYPTPTNVRRLVEAYARQSGADPDEVYRVLSDLAFPTEGGLGTVAYRGTVPPHMLDVAEDVEPWGAEYGKMMLDALERRLKAGEAVPWWLR